MSYSESSDSSESLLSGSPTFVTASGASGFGAGGGAFFLFVFLAFSSPSSSCSATSTCDALSQGEIAFQTTSVSLKIVRVALTQHGEFRYTLWSIDQGKLAVISIRDALS